MLLRSLDLLMFSLIKRYRCSYFFPMKNSSFLTLGVEEVFTSLSTLSGLSILLYWAGLQDSLQGE